MKSNKFRIAKLKRIVDNKVLFWICFSIVIVLFAVAYNLTSIVPHTLFRTYALDLGMFNHALYRYAHLKYAHFTLAIDGSQIPYLGDHFSPLTMFYAPFYYLFGTYTLLIIQIAAILYGGYGLFIYARYKGLNEWLSLVIMTQFFSLWPIFSALSYDFHNNVVAAMLVPWFFFHYEKGNLKKTLLFFTLILIAKENMALWMTFILIGLLLLRNSKSPSLSWKTTIILATISLIYFLVVILIVMPAYSKGLGTNQLARYGSVDGNTMDVLVSMFVNPAKYFSLLFEDTLSIGYAGVKSGFWFLFLVSGGFALFYKPQYLVMILPILAQKMYSSNVNMWGTLYQYSIELAPVISIALIAYLTVFKSNTGKFILLVLVIFANFFYNKNELKESNIPIFRSKHYQTNLNIKEIRQAFKLIPDSEAISVSSQLAPHLAFRDVIHHFPIINNSKYIILLKKGNPYPLDQNNYKKTLVQFIADSSNVIYNSEDLLIYKVTKELNNNFNPIDYNIERIKEIERYIKATPQWYDQVKEKAKKLEIPVDSALREDAKWVYRKKLKERI